MKKGCKMQWLAAGALAMALAATGCTAAAAQPEPSALPMKRNIDAAAPVSAGTAEPEIGVNRAMYVPFGKDSHVMVDQETGMVYVVSMPEEIYNRNGDKIAPEDLVKGNIVEIYGNGVMAESYPGQYHGVTKIQVVEEGAPSDADQYQDLIDQLYQEPDLNSPPTMQVEYRTPDAIVTAAIQRGGYSWSVEGEDGQMQSTIACGPHLLQMELSDMKLPGATQFALDFYPEAPREVRVVRWPAEQLGTPDAAEITAGEPVPVEEQEGVFALAVEPDYVYGVTGVWDRGEAEFGFVALKKE